MRFTKIGGFIVNLFCVLAFCVGVSGAPGDLDLTFDLDGKTLTGFGALDFARDVAIQPDGKIVVVGFSGNDFTINNLNVSLARYNTDGSLDTTFGTGGKISLVESGSEGIASVIIQPDGKILAVGNRFFNLGAYRFNADGTPDTTFGTGGIVTHVIGRESDAHDAALQPDGKIVLAGFVTFVGETPRFAVFRLNPDGSLDTSFNSVGYTPVPIGWTYATSVALQSDGKIVAGGKDAIGNIGVWGRFGADGILEGGVSALVRTNVEINDVAIQTDGKIVFAGVLRIPGAGMTDAAVTRYNADKTIDAHFGNGGTGTVRWGGGNSSFHRANSLFIQPSGRIVVGGVADFQTNDFGIARFNSSGFLDVGFGNGGRVTTQFSPFGEESYAVAQQADGKIVAVGHGLNGKDGDFAVARYDGSDSNTGQFRTQFDYDGDGRADVSVFRPSTGEWFIFNSGNGTVGIRTFGVSGDAPAPADYDADGKTDIAIRRPFSEPGGGWWYLLSDGSGVGQQYPFAPGGDYARPGDYTGDGRADIVTYNSSNSLWARMNFTSAESSSVTFGSAGDKPLLGDFDGDAKVDPAVYRPSTGEWWYAASSAGGQHRAVRWGISTDIPAPADYDGDHKTDYAVYRPSEGVWYIFNSSNGSFTILNFGLAEDKPVPADYDGDGKADIAVFRPSTGVWYLMRSTAGFTAMQFGVSTDIPTPNAFIP